MKSVVLFALMVLSSVALATTVPYEDIPLPKGTTVVVHDGDTIYVTIPKYPRLFGDKIGVRLMGIDTPELHSQCATPEERAREEALSIKARDFLASVVANAKTITLVHPDRDKYFRIDATVVLDKKINTSELMIKEGYADPYDGGTKKGWCGR